MVSGPNDGVSDLSSSSGEIKSIGGQSSSTPPSGVAIIRCPRCQLAMPATERICPNDGTDLFFRPGQIFAEKYELLDLVGAGGMGVIYRARHLILDKIVAIKVLFNNNADSNLIMRFQREAKAASSLSHINVITVYDFGIVDGVKPYMVMDYLPGRTLAELLKKCGTLPVRMTLEIVEQVLAALTHAHKKGVLHRDLKPGNIMLLEEADEPTLVKILDFGLAKIVDGDDQVSLSQVGAAMGSPAYMSPEQATGLKVDKRADLFSLGCIAFELLSGKPPLLGDSPMETLVNRLNRKAPPLSEACRNPVRSRAYKPGKEIPTIVELFVSKLLERDPRDRFQSAQEARNYLGTIWQYLDPSAPDHDYATAGGAMNMEPKLRSSGSSMHAHAPGWRGPRVHDRSFKTSSDKKFAIEEEENSEIENQDIEHTEIKEAGVKKDRPPRSASSPVSVRDTVKEIRLDRESSLPSLNTIKRRRQVQNVRIETGDEKADRPQTKSGSANSSQLPKKVGRRSKSRSEAENAIPQPGGERQGTALDFKSLDDWRRCQPQLFWLVILLAVSGLVLICLIVLRS